MDRDSHLNALPDEMVQNPGIGFRMIHIGIRDIREKCSLTGVNEDLIHPFAADIIRGVPEACHNFQPADRFSGAVAVHQHHALIGEPVLLGKIREHFRHMRFVRDQNHRPGHTARAAVFEDIFPQQRGQISQNQVQCRGEIDRNAAVIRPALHREHIECHDQEDEQGLLERLDEFDVIAALQDIVEGVECDGNQNVRDEEDHGEGAVGLVRVRIAPSMPDDIGNDKGDLKHDGVDQDEVDVFQPSLAIALVHSLFSVSGIRY